MSIEGRELKKKAAEDYFAYHPDSVTVSVVGSEVTFPGFFDYAFFSNNPDAADVRQIKRAPHLTIYSGNADLLTERVTVLEIEGYSRQFTVYNIKSDKTFSAYQAEVWLI